MLADDSTESRGVLHPLRIPSVIRPERRTFVLSSDELMSCFAAGTNSVSI